MEDFKNLTEKASFIVTTKEPTPFTYIITQDCVVTCVSLGGHFIESDSLIQEMAFNISTTVLPVMMSLQSQLLNNTSVFTTEFPKVNSTEYMNNTFENFTFYNNSADNATVYNITDLTYFFSDYLTFILNSLKGQNETIIPDTSTILTTTEVATIETFETFKSTIMPFLTQTSLPTDDDYGRFDYDLSTVYNKISSTVNSLKENCSRTCTDIKIPIYKNITTLTIYDSPQDLNYTMRARLRSLCWETMFGQELIRLTVMDLVMTIASTLAMDFFRGLFVRVMNR